MLCCYARDGHVSNVDVVGSHFNMVHHHTAIVMRPGQVDCQCTVSFAQYNNIKVARG